MAFWNIDPLAVESGFATPAAAVISLGLAVVASALTVLAITDLRRAKAEALKARAEYQLEGVHQRASLVAITEPKAVRLAWSIPTPRGPADVLAEAEGVKLGLKGEHAPGADVLSRLGVRDPSALRQRLLALSRQEAMGPALEAADEAPMWRACARSLISAFGVASVPPKLQASTPSQGVVISRIGEVWRIRATADGWADDRIVRLTGDPQRLAAVIERRVYRRPEGRDQCDALFAAR